MNSILKRLFFSGIILSLFSSILCAQQGWDTVAVILHAIVPPTFPSMDYNVLSFGADSSGKVESSSAFKRAIDTCSLLGGGRVVVPKGTYLTGAIRLKSNVNFYVSSGTTIKFSTDTAKYMPVVYTRFESTELMNFSPLIYAYGDSNIAVTGSGTLDGQATSSNWWAWKSKSSSDTTILNTMVNNNIPVAQRIFGSGHYLRPNFFQPYSCKNVLIQDVTLKDSPMWFINPILCTNVSVLNVTVTANSDDTRPNTDGCDPECCTNVLIQGCKFNTGDDCVAIKSGRNADGRRVNIPCKNIIIQNCSMTDGHGGITVGSEVSGSVRNVFAQYDTMNSSNLQYGIRFKSNMARGGTIENCYYKNIVMMQVLYNVLYATLSYGGEKGSYIPTLKNIYLDSITCSKASSTMLSLTGLSASNISNIVFSNCAFTNISSKTIDTSYVTGLKFSNTILNGSTLTGLATASSTLPVQYMLEQNYPNPFNPSTTISYSIPAGTQNTVSLRVYDIIGREIAILVNGTKAAGSYNALWNASACASGMYIAKLTVGKTVQSIRMLLVK
jgi:polygalacturonase